MDHGYTHTSGSILSSLVSMTPHHLPFSDSGGLRFSAADSGLGVLATAPVTTLTIFSRASVCLLSSESFFFPFTLDDLVFLGMFFPPLLVLQGDFLAGDLLCVFCDLHGELGVIWSPLGDFLFFFVGEFSGVSWGEMRGDRDRFFPLVPAVFCPDGFDMFNSVPVSPPPSTMTSELLSGTFLGLSASFSVSST